MKKVTTEGQVVGVDKKIPFFEKFFLAATPGISTFYFMMISTWLLYFYTDIMKINAAFVGVMFVVVRILDAIITPVAGVYMDRQNTKWGKYKPWILIIWLGICILAFLVFYPVNFGIMGKTIYATVTYTIFSILMSITSGPTIGMTAAITKRQDDRMTIGLLQFVFALVFSMSVSIAVLPLTNLLGHGNQGEGFKGFLLIFGAVNAILVIIGVKTMKERFVIKPEDQPKFDIKLVLDSFLKNKYAVITLLYIFALNLTTAIRNAVAIYYYKYYFSDESMMMAVGMMSLPFMLVGVFLSPAVTKKLGIKVNILLMVFSSIITSIGMFILPPTAGGKMGFFVLYIIGNVFAGMAQPAQQTMLPAAVDYGEWKFNANNGGFLGTISGFVQTLATAVSGGLTALILALVHYVPDAQQTSTSLNGIKFLMCILPALVYVIGFVMFKWDLSEKKHKEIIDDLKSRREAAATVESV